MATEVIVALIGLIGIIVGGIFKTFANNLNNRLDRLEKKVDLHNGYAQKFGEINASIAEINTALKFIQKGMK